MPRSFCTSKTSECETFQAQIFWPALALGAFGATCVGFNISSACTRSQEPPELGPQSREVDSVHAELHSYRACAGCIHASALLPFALSDILNHKCYFFLHRANIRVFTRQTDLFERDAQHVHTRTQAGMNRGGASAIGLTSMEVGHQK